MEKGQGSAVMACLKREREEYLRDLGTLVMVNIESEATHGNERRRRRFYTEQRNPERKARKWVSVL